MKLPDRKIINTEANQFRKSQIDEGVRIATKVDKLREELVSLEAQHKKFIDATKVELTNQTKGLIDQIDTLKGEIKSLEERRKVLLKPLDDEWAKLKEEQDDFIKKNESLVLKSNELTEKEKGIAETQKQVASKEKQIEEQACETERVARETLELNEGARKLKETQSIEYDRFTHELSERNREFAIKEQEVMAQMSLNENRNKALNTREKELQDKERFINDKYETLKRTINRLNT